MLPLLNEGPKVVKPYVEIFWSQPSKKGAEAPLIVTPKPPPREVVIDPVRL